jgi:hypothetical protein
MKMTDEELQKILARRARKRKNKINFKVGSLVKFGDKHLVVTQIKPTEPGTMGTVTYLNQFDSKYYEIYISQAIKYFEIIVF